MRLTRSGQDELKTKAGKLAACKTLAYELFAPQTCSAGELENYGGGSLPTLAYGATKQHKANCGKSLRTNYGTVPAVGQ